MFSLSTQKIKKIHTRSKMMKNKDKIVRRAIGIPSDLWAKIQKSAESNCRTAASELVFRLFKSFEING